MTFSNRAHVWQHSAEHDCLACYWCEIRRHWAGARDACQGGVIANQSQSRKRKAAMRLLMKVHEPRESSAPRGSLEQSLEPEGNRT